MLVWFLIRCRCLVPHLRNLILPKMVESLNLPILMFHRFCRLVLLICSNLRLSVPCLIWITLMVSNLLNYLNPSSMGWLYRHRMAKRLAKIGSCVDTSYMLYLNNDEPIVFALYSDLISYLSNYRENNPISKIQIYRIETYSL